MNIVLYLCKAKKAAALFPFGDENHKKNSNVILLLHQDVLPKENGGWSCGKNSLNNGLNKFVQKRTSHQHSLQGRDFWNVCKEKTTNNLNV